MRQAAADGTAIADLIMRDMLDGGDQEWMRAAQPLVVENIAPAHHGAERNAVIGDFDLAQFRDLAQIDQQGRRGDAERQHRHETLPAGEQLRLAVKCGQQRHSLGNAWRTDIVEGRKFHPWLNPLRGAELLAVSGISYHPAFSGVNRMFLQRDC